MIRLAIAIAFGLLFSGAAKAQGCGPTNPSCVVPTAPFGTSNNQAASTAFVQSAVIGVALPQNKIFVGQPTNIAGAVIMSGDCSIVASGAITCLKLNGISPGAIFPLNIGTGLGTSANNLNINLSVTPQVRITLNTGTPVMLTNYSAQTTVFVTPYIGNLIPIYDGTNMVPTQFAEVSQATTDATKSPAAVTTNANYDIFCWVDTGPTNRCTRGPVWTSLTARSAGTALVRVQGILLNSVSITNGPAAQRGTYVGTISSDGSSQINWIFGAVAANCTAGNFAVWNMYNRVDVENFIGDTTVSWTYATANTWRQANASANCKISAVRGYDEDGVNAAYNALALSGAATTQLSGIGLNSTTASVGTTGYTASTTVAGNPRAEYSGLMGIGYNYFAALEWQNTTTSSSWFGTASVSAMQTGMHVRLKQ